MQLKLRTDGMSDQVIHLSREFFVPIKKTEFVNGVKKVSEITPESKAMDIMHDLRADGFRLYMGRKVIAKYRFNTEEEYFEIKKQKEHASKHRQVFQRSEKSNQRQHSGKFKRPERNSTGKRNEQQVQKHSAQPSQVA